MKDEDIKWLKENFDESKWTCLKLMHKAEMEGTADKDDYMMALKMVKKAFPEKRSLKDLLEIFIEMSRIGCVADKAGKVLAERIELIRSFNREDEQREAERIADELKPTGQKETLLKELETKLAVSRRYDEPDPKDSIMTCYNICECDDGFLCEHRLAWIVDFFRKHITAP